MQFSLTMYSLHSLYSSHQPFQGVKSSGLYTEKYGNIIFIFLLQADRLVKIWYENKKGKTNYDFFYLKL